MEDKKEFCRPKLGSFIILCLCLTFQVKPYSLLNKFNVRFILDSDIMFKEWLESRN